MRKGYWLGLGIIVLSLSACGGGGGGDDDNNGGGGSPGGSSPDSSNSAPIAEAGAQQNVLTGSAVRLDGSASGDPDDDPIFYQWTFQSRPSGSDAVLRNADSAVPLFTADVAGRYVVRLVVNDDTDSSDPDTVRVVASAPNSAPVADAGESREVPTGSTVTLDGSASSDADDPVQGLNYSWTLVSQPGTGQELVDADTISPSFTAATSGNYVVRLVVNDGTVNSTPDEITIRATSGNVAPVANAGGDRGVAVGSTVVLDGLGSRDVDDNLLAYSWRLISAPQGSGATLREANTPAPSFVADAVGAYVVQVTVRDDDGARDSDRAVITAGPTLVLSADGENDGSFEAAEFPYDERFGRVTQAPNEGFVIGRFRLTARDGDFTLTNLTFRVDAPGRYVAAFDGFQDFDDGTRQVTLPAGETAQFSLNVNIPENSDALVTYSFTVVETGERFTASYRVVSDDN